MPTNIDLHVTLSVIIFLNSAIHNVTAGIGLKNPLSVGLWQKSRDLDPDPAENSNVNIWFVNNFQEKKSLVKVLFTDVTSLHNLPTKASLPSIALADDNDATFSSLVTFCLNIEHVKTKANKFATWLERSIQSLPALFRVQAFKLPDKKRHRQSPTKPLRNQ